jgi:hypothetical protein
MEKNLKASQELRDELKQEIYTLYNMGVESYEVEYLLSLKNYD